MSNNTKQYDERNALSLGNYYSRHVHAMTVESLHSKSDIAAELGYRDKQIDELNAKLFDQSILLDAAISRAEATKKREKHANASIDVLTAKNAELEGRLQQPIKLRSRIFEMMNVGGGHSIQVVSVKAVKQIIRAAGFKVAEVDEIKQEVLYTCPTCKEQSYEDMGGGGLRCCDCGQYFSKVEGE